MKFYIHAIKNYNYFDERTARTPFWSFVSYNILFATIAFWLDLILKLRISDSFLGYIYVVYSVFVFLPGIAIAIRRLHDVDKSGWNLLWAFLPIIGSFYLIYLFTKPSEIEENIYGKNPNSEPEISSFINAEKTNNNIVILLFSWIILSKCFWIVLKNLNIDLFQSPYYFLYNGLITLIWAVFPFMVSRLFKNQNLKIIASILSLLYILYSLFEYLNFILSQSKYFQF